MAEWQLFRQVQVQVFLVLFVPNSRPSQRQTKFRWGNTETGKDKTRLVARILHIHLHDRFTQVSSRPIKSLAE